MGLNWVASGGLDRKVCLWDLNGGGKTLEIDTQGEDKPEKGSVYALSAGRNIIAVGSPEKTVRLYDSRSGTRFSKMVGHTDNIRSILIGDSGELILSASADKTIKMWSTRAGRCLYTFTMHDAPVWALRSDHPELRVFHSADRDGLIAKTDVRGKLEDMDNGLSLAVAQEHNKVWGMTVADGHIWTATMQSSINRWADIDMDDYSYLRESMKRHRGASVASRGPRPMSISAVDGSEQKKVSPQSILQLSNTAPVPFRPASVSAPAAAVAKGGATESPAAAPTTGTQLPGLSLDEPSVKPIHQNPTETIEGQFGLLKHQLLNDRRRVLTVDTAGEVVMWDLIQCRQMESFGKMHLDEVAEMRNTPEAVAPWCHIDLASGNLTVVLEQYNCFDAEVYADQLKLEEAVEFREDQRISLGRWILRSLFANLIDEELKRDEVYRAALNEGVEKRQVASRANAPTSIPLPPQNMAGWETPDQTTTPRANGLHMPTTTPGLAINQATPGPGLTGVSENAVATPLSPLEKRQSHTSRPSGDHDYFTSTIGPADTAAKAPATPSTPAAETTDADKTKDKAQDTAKSPTSAFGKKFRMSFGTKKIGRSASQTATEKPVIPEEKAEESEASSTHEKEVEDNFLGVIQKMRNDYDRQLIEQPDQLVETRMSPSLPNETPVLKLPPNTKIFIQEETSGSVANVYEGTIAGVGADADVIEHKAPMWLGHVLLQNQITSKEPVKISFVLHPLGDLPPVASADGNNRLNANRMLRVKKIIGYVVERIEQPAEEPEENPLKPEEYMELYCNGQLLDPLMSLATLRTHVWKSGNDIVLQYKANGRKEMRFAPPPEEPAPEPEAGQDGGIIGEAQPTAPPAAPAQAT
ncbi:uncharacterized protein F5Z01DRAFT_483536 [Emericellopsis atlantica]|uniref:WD repeat protein n=1 Tax=Emericellopsis atlantica TaxID=2614577 RepID=A0A9P7ZR01_9HYPO|nr:uncharacterized protein F5Z01DRAFT_483536 [Emericellopsis atlantica]KAG9256703.1 hypothetical protein F5Z01DRAFT_483536 [Emericellopsis atlantica]